MFGGLNQARADLDKHEKRLTVRLIILSRMQESFCSLSSSNQESLKICSRSALDHPLHD